MAPRTAPRDRCIVPAVRHDGGQPVGGLLAGDGAAPGLS